MADKREELLRMLNKALLFEESGIAILGNTYRTFVEKDKVSGLTAVQKQKVSKMMGYLIEDSERHGKLLRRLIGRISQEGRNAS